MTDPIADILNRIKTASLAKKPSILVSFSKIKNEISNILAKEGFILDAKSTVKNKVKFIKINLKYSDSVPAIEDFRRISSPGQRIYTNYQSIRKVKAGLGISIISTSKGLMTGEKAKKEKLGGEIICEVW